MGYLSWLICTALTSRSPVNASTAAETLAYFTYDFILYSNNYKYY